MNPALRYAVVACALWLSACPVDDVGRDGGPGDAGPSVDAGPDAGTGGDAGTSTGDAGAAPGGGDDAGEPAPGAADAGSDAREDAGALVDGGAVTAPLGCPDPLPSAWIFCDDFEQDRLASYFEYVDDDGEFVRTTSEAASGSYSMQVVWQPGEVGAGNLKVIFGRNPIGTGLRPDEDFTEIYWRMRVKHEEGWSGNPAKLSRATVFSGSDWSQAMIAHLWSSNDETLLADPATCVEGGVVQCQGYNDFANLDWLGQLPGSTRIFSTEDSGRWRCVEGHARLNTPGSADGVFEFFIDGNLEAGSDSLDWRGTYTEYGINAVFFENYWNEGPPGARRRWFDDLAIATEPIGCE